MMLAGPTAGNASLQDWLQAQEGGLAMAAECSLIHLTLLHAMLDLELSMPHTFSMQE